MLFRSLAQGTVYGLETEFNRAKQAEAIKKANPNDKTVYKFIQYNKNHSSLKYPLGLSAYDTNNVPSWDLQMKSGEILTGSFTSTYSPYADYYENIPQINCSCSYVYEVRKDVDMYDKLTSTIDNKIIYKSIIYPDSKYYIVREMNNIHMMLKELNATFEKENFDIEIFEVTDATSGNGAEEILTNLNFNDDFYIIEGEADVPSSLNEKDVEWYFSILEDQNIAASEIDEQIYGLVESQDPYADANADKSQEPC